MKQKRESDPVAVAWLFGSPWPTLVLESYAHGATFPVGTDDEDLNFETGSAALAPDSKRVVNDLIIVMKSYPTARGRLEGHTDDTGDAAANKQLSDARARSVRDAMLAGGIDTARLDAAGFGQERPIASNDTDAGRAKNRRTELVITGK